MKRLVLVAPIAVLLALGCNGAGDPNATKTSSSSTTPPSTTPPSTTPPSTTPPSTTPPSTSPPTSSTTTTPPATTPPAQPAQPGTFDVLFAPNGTSHDIEKAICDEIGNAQSTIDIAMYNFTSPQIGDAVMKANKRGVAVRVIFDQYQSKLQVSLDVDFKSAGVPFKYMNPTGPVKALKFHHKFGIIDKKLVIGGSYNWTESADEVNYENCLFMRDPAIVQAYAQEFESIYTNGKGGVGSTGDVKFAPTGTAAVLEQTIVDEVNKAQKEIVIAMYEFTSSKVAKAVAAAIKRGVAVSIVTDNGEQSLNATSLTTCAGAQMKKAVLQNGALFHDKYCVIDGQTLIVGSFNWNVNQDKYGYENLNVLHDPALCQKYLANFAQIWSSSIAH